MKGILKNWIFSEYLKGKYHRYYREKYKIIVGGGPVTQTWADKIGADGYAENAAGAIELAKKLLTKNARHRESFC